MQTLQLRSRTAPDGTITLQLPPELANQDLDFIIVYQPTSPLSSETSDPLIGLFSGSPNLAIDSEDILQNTITVSEGAEGFATMGLGILIGGIPS
jgi:hypothetical protein